jgi:hypothetical protein
MGRLSRLGTPLLVLLAVIAVLVLADVGIVAVRLASGHPFGAPVATQQGGHGSTAHPCNHGADVSRAAHLHKGGAYVRGIARSMKTSCAPRTNGQGD